MFYAIHRALKFAFFCAMCWVVWRIYQHRQVFEPALIWYDVWDNGGWDAKPMPTVYGDVEKVLSSQVFVLKQPNATRLNVRLLGLKDPAKDTSHEAVEKERDRKKALEDLLKGKTVRLDIGYENFNNVGGIVYLNKTNINALLVHEHLAFTDKELIKPFPRDVQYQMLWSKKHHATNTLADARVR